MLVANLDPGRRAARCARRPAALLERFAGGLTTQEVAQLLTRGNDAPDRTEAEAAMLNLVAAGLGDTHLAR